MRGLHLDTRIGGHPKWRICDERELMQVPPDLLKCVCFVERRSAAERKFCGTAFFVSKHLEGVLPSVNPDPNVVYVVTAAHVLRDAFGDPWDEIRLCLNTKDGHDFIETAFDDWEPHLQSDVAVLSLTPDESYFDYQHYPIDSHVDPEFFMKWGLTPGDDVLVTGLLWAHPDLPHITPIVREGHVAAFPQQPVNLSTGPEGAVLIEVLSFGGLSGSPAFLHLGDFRRDDQGRGELYKLGGAVGPTGGNWLLGVVHGLFEKEDEDPRRPLPTEPLNVGITALIPAARIAEVLDDSRYPFAKERMELVKRLNESAPKTRPTSTSATPPKQESEYERFEALARQLVNTPKPKREAKPKVDE